MSIDERARRAGTDLLERAAARPLPEVEQAVPRRRASGRLPALAAAGVLVVAAVVALWPSEGPEVATVPDGVEPVPWTPEGLGLTVQVPSTWDEQEGFHAATGDGSVFVLAHRWIGLRPDSTEDSGRARVRQLEAEGAADVELDLEEIDGRSAAVLRYRYPDGEGGFAHDTEHLVDLGDGTFVGVVVGEMGSTDHDELREWVASTIEVDPDAVDRLWPVEPSGEVRPPAGVEPQSFAPPRFAASMQVPSTWVESTRARTRGFLHGVHPPSGGGSVLMTTHSTPMARRAAEVERLAGVDAVISGPTEVDGRAAVVTQYTLPTDDERARLAVAEYAVDLDDGTTLLVTIGNTGLHDDALLDWLRSTIRIAG